MTGGYSSWAGNAVVLSGSLQGLHLLAYGDTAPADIVSLFDADAYWVRDNPADPGVRMFNDLNDGRECTNNLNGTVTVTVSAGGEYPGQHSFAFAPDRLNVQSYFRCDDLGVMRQSPDQIARTRDALENRHRHHLIARHLGPLPGTSLSQTDSLPIGHGLLRRDATAPHPARSARALASADF